MADEEVTSDTPTATAPPAAATPPAGAQPPVPFVGADDQQDNSWSSAATPPEGGGGQGPTFGADGNKVTGPEVPTEQAPGSTATIPSVEAPAPPPAPPIVTPQGPPGIFGFVQRAMDAMVGKTRPEIGTDPSGQKYVKQVSLTHGEQWIKLGSEALHGAAAGWAAGRGNNPAGALAAGVKAGDQQAQQAKQDEADMSDEARKQNLEEANHQMSVMKLAEQTWNNTRLGVKATQEDSAAEDKTLKDATDAGETLAGVMRSPADLRNILPSQPNIMEDMVQRQMVHLVPHYADGKQDGFNVLIRPQGWDKEMLPAGSSFNVWDPSKNQVVEQQAAAPMSKLQQSNYNLAAANAKQKFMTDQHEADFKASETAKNKAETTVIPSTIRKNNAEANNANAEATKEIAEANKLKTPDVNDPNVATLGEAVARGTLTEDQISKFGKGTQTAIEAYLAQHHPNLDQKSVFLDGGMRKQVNLASNALENLGSIESILKRRPELLGVINGRVSEGKELTGTNDPDLATINTALDNYGLASTGAHGIRAVQARADAKKALLNGFKNGPQGVEASIGAARMSLTNLASAGKPRSIDGTPYTYNQQPQQGATPPGPTPPGAAPTAPPPLPTGTPPPAAGMKRVWAPGMATWKDVPASAVKSNIPGQVVQ